MKKMNINKTITMVFSVVMALSLLVGCGTSPTPDTAKTQDTAQTTAEDKAAGTILLSVNPEIEVEYDNDGLVLEIEGVNEDGRNVVSGFENYKGKDCQAVVSALVKKIYEAGYFEKTVDGHTKNIVLKLEEDSAYPNDDFLEEIAEGVREAVTSCGISSSAITIQEDDLDDKGLIGQEKAKELLLAQLGLTSASFTNHEYDLDDGVYEFEFSANGVTYEYEVDARTGKILEADFDHNDDWDDFDDQNDDLDDNDDQNDDLDDFDNQNDDLDDDDDLNDLDDQYDDRNDDDDDDDDVDVDDDDDDNDNADDYDNDDDDDHDDD